MTSGKSSAVRPPLSKERVLQAAIDLVDRSGLNALTMRRLGAELGVEAMSLYKHVSNKDEILDGMVEFVIGAIEVPREGANWKEAMRRRANSAREVLGRHSWAIGLFESRGSIGPTTMGYLDAILGNLRSGGFSIESSVHAFWLLDSFVYGHVIQEANLPFRTSGDMAASQEPLEEITMRGYPHLVEIGEHARRSDYSVDIEFEYGLELILDALERSALRG